MMDVMKVSLEAVAALRGPLTVVRAADVDLHRQIRRAASSMTLNIAEANRRGGRDRIHQWRVAAGSADEVRAGLYTAIAWGDLEAASVRKPLELIDRVVAMLWRLTH